MKKCIIALTILAMTITGCNKQIIDTTFNYDKAILTLPNGELIEGNIDNSRDYEDGDQIQVKINEITYLVHSENIVLIADKK